MYPTLISVVIPCYNRANYIRIAVDSALDQTWESKEIIVVDDGSTDNSLEILKSYGDRIARVSQTNGGVASARNTGISHASGTWIALLDSDDLWLPEKLERQMQLAAKFPETVLVHTRCATIDSTGSPYGKPAVRQEDAFEPSALFDLMHHCFPTTSSVVIRKDVLLQSGCFDVEFEQNGGFAAEDWELYVRVAELGPFAVVGDPLTLYRVHGDSKTLSDRLRHTNGLIKLRDRIDQRSKAWADMVDRAKLEAALAVHREQYAHVLARRGTILMHDSDWAGAADAFEKATRIEPKLKHQLRYFWAKLHSTVRANGVMR